MKEVKIAVAFGDGSAPEMMEQACLVAVKAAKLDGIKIHFVETSMGWSAYDKYGDTLPEESFRKATEIGTLFFGGVGDPERDKETPGMAPEPRCLLRIRKDWGLLLNFRTMIFRKDWAHLAGVRPERIPDGGVIQVWLRFLLEDSYFGNQDLFGRIPEDIRKELGIFRNKTEVTGKEEIVTDLAYYRRSTLMKYFRSAFSYAKQAGLPLICVDKKNVMPRYALWRAVCEEVAREFPEVEVTYLYVDAANERHFTPAALHGVIACGNEHGDILTDAAVKAWGSMGLMYSSSINPDTGLAMFESGAGTAPDLRGKDKANPIGRILTAALMLRHIGAQKGAEAIESAVNHVLQEGYRTPDMVSDGDDSSKVIGTKGMGKAILSRIP